tara:strand:- start:640 stop:819 length:180 start_codon:yes stop_codon:yes gene_type:complete
MVIKEVFNVLEDGCVMHMETGAIQWPSRNKKGQKYFILDGQFFLQRNLLELLRNEIRED